MSEAVTTASTRERDSDGQRRSIPFSFFEQSPRFRSGGNTIEPVLPSDEPVLVGRFRTLRLREGLTLHATDTEDLHDLTTCTNLDPGFGFYLFIEDGEGLDASVDGRPLPVGRHRGGAGGSTGFAMSWRARARFRRRAARGTRVRKALVIVSHEWLEQTFGRNSVAIPPAALEHLAISRWSPSYRLRKLAEGLLEPDLRGDAVSRLRDESVALDLVAEAVATLEPPTGAAALRRTEALQLTRARDLIEARLSTDLAVAALAGELAIGVSALQRLFRVSQGCSVYEYIRDRRLDQARALLEQGRSVTAAAEAAGYSSPANFATAFRRKFGMTPTMAREGLQV